MNQLNSRKIGPSILLLFLLGIVFSCIDGNLPVSDSELVITSFNPVRGSPGSVVTILGENFNGEPGMDSVFFNGYGAKVISSYSNLLVAIVPDDATSGPITVHELKNRKRAVSSDDYEVIAGDFPVIYEVRPNSGVVGSSFLIIGDNFGTDIGKITALIGSDTTEVTAVNDTTVATYVPVGATTGLVSVIKDGYTAKGPEFTIIDENPVIHILKPNHGPIGSMVWVIGQYFSSVSDQNTITLNGVEAEILEAYNDSLKTSVPVGATTGNVVVTVGGKASNGVNFIVEATAPQITSLTPNAGKVGSTVKIIGTNFGATPASNTVTFNGTTTTVTSASTTELVVTVPVGATTGNVVVTVGGLASNGVNFTVQQPTAPQITSLTPNAGKVGSTVKIIGTNFGATPASNIVTFNGTATTVASASTTELVVTVPVGATTGNVVVTVGGLASNGVNFTVQPTAPQITSLTPNAGKVGSTVKIIGTNFGPTPASNTVTFNGTNTTVTSASTTELVVTVPVGATTGNVVVTVGGLASNGVTFTVQPTAPQITSLTPNAGKVGSSVKIIGTNFGVTPASNTVTFNGATTTVTSASTTELVVTVPVGATTGNVVVTVGGLASNGVNFTVQPTVPQITSLTPNAGEVGFSVKIVGTNFGATPATNAVTFNGTTATVTSASTTELVVTVPVGATTGNVVVTVGGLASNGVNFTVQPTAPQITSLTPNAGNVGSSVKIIGTNFSATPGQNVVTFNGTTTTVTSASAIELVVTVPVGATTGNVVVTVGGLASNGVNFTVQPTAPQITSLAPNAGNVGSTVKITGTNFGATPATNTVTFNGTAATVTSASTTDLAVTVPMGATTGSVVVTVGGLASNGVNFTVQLTAPQITSLTPNAGSVGSSVKVVGTNFGATPATNTVTFNGTTATVTSASTTDLSVTVPVGATTGNVVVTVGGQASNGVNFTVQ